MRAFTPYVEFTMRVFYPKDLDNPSNGTIKVISYDNLSAPVAKLIADTTWSSMSEKRLKEILEREVYTFKE